MSKDRKLGIGTVLIGLVICVYSQLINVKVELNEPGPRLFPLIAGLGILACGIGIYLTAAKSSEDKIFLDKDGFRRLGISLLILVGYTILLNIAGFVIATPVAVVAMSRLFSQKKYNYVVGAAVGLITTGVVYGLFSAAFNLPLPRGILF